MKIDNAKDLEKAIKLCRKLGVDSIKIGDVEFHLGSAPQQTSKVVKTTSKQLETTQADPSIITEDTKILSDELTDEQRLFWSAVDPTAEPQQVEQ